jgi:hypothetical protein
MYSAQEERLKILDEQSQLAKELTRMKADVLKLDRELGEATYLLQNTRETMMHLKATQDLQAQQCLSLESTLPTFIYSYQENTDQLHRTSLVTGEHSSHRVPSYQFKDGCCWSEVPGGSLLITGGGYPAAVTEAVRLDVRTFAVSPQREMRTARRRHAVVYHAQHVYVIGGYDGVRCLSECERYVCTENRWQDLPHLPRACFATSGVVVEGSLYALGGNDGHSLDLVQKLSLDRLTWDILYLRLPYAGYGIPCFKLRDTEVYLVVNKTLCSFTALEVRLLKTLGEDIFSWRRPSYFCRGTLYCSSNEGAARSYEIV